MSEGYADSYKVLFFPLGVTYVPNGNILITDGGGWADGGWQETKSKVMEVNRLGEIVWLYGKDLCFAHNARRLVNGNTLIADTGNNRIVEVTLSGETVWDTGNMDNNRDRLSDGSTLSYPNDVQHLDNDNILISDRNNNRIIEIDRAGNIIWKYERCNHQHGIHRTPKGHTLFTDSENNMALEIDSNGQEVWSYGDHTLLRWPRDANRLKNGNTIIADSRNNRIIEVDTVGNTVWTYNASGITTPYEVDVDEKGQRILISEPDARQVKEVDRQGNVLWCFRNYYRKEPLFGKIENGDFAFCQASHYPSQWFPSLNFCERVGSFSLYKNYNEQNYKHALNLCLKDRGFMWFSQSISVVANRPYEINGVVRTSNVKGYAQIQVAFLDADGNYLDGGNSADFPGGKRFSGDNDWHESSSIVWSPPNATAASIRCYLVHKGEAWFTAITFERIRKIIP